MLQLIYKFIFLGLSLFFVGCSSTQPEFNPNDTMTVKTINGEMYTIPKGTTHTREAVTLKVISFYKKIGVSDCHEGDITWEEIKTSEMINSILRNATKEEGIALYKKAASERKIGCASAHQK